MNHYNVDGQEDKEALNQMIFTHYEGDSLQILPACECGATTGTYEVDMLCPVCNTTVNVVTERPLESLLWLMPPKGVDVFVHPHFWTILSGFMTFDGHNLLRWLCDPMMNLPDNNVREFARVKALKVRGINQFHKEFDTLLPVLLEQGLIKANKKQYIIDLMDYIQKNRSRLFCRYLPIPSKLGFVTERTVTNSYSDQSRLPAVDAIWTISAVENSTIPLTPRQLQSHSVKANILLADYYEYFVAKILGKKKGVLRRNCAGSRQHYTFRAVISGLFQPHYYRELHLPWSMSVLVFKMHLINKLFKLGYTPNAAYKLIYESVLRHDPLIDRLFKEMIADSPGGRGIPVLLGRNPTLTRGSIQKFFVTKIDPDVSVNSIAMSVLTLKAPNCKCTNLIYNPPVG